MMRYTTLSRYALSLPAVTEQPHHDYRSFRVRGKIFATVPPGDTHVHLFIADEDREAALFRFPAFVEKLLWGGKVVGVRVCLADAETPVVKQLVHKAWRNKAPRSLITQRHA